MNSFIKAMSAAASGMNVQGYRMRVVSENVANADTPGYQRKVAAFDNVYDRAAGVSRVQIGNVSLDPTEPEEKYNPAHPMADERGYVQMSNVNMMIEMADGREANRSYEANLASFQQARQMYASLLELLKR
jgi:flagellar basal-body rod protein FlgC